MCRYSPQYRSIQAISEPRIAKDESSRMFIGRVLRTWQLLRKDNSAWTHANPTCFAPLSEIPCGRLRSQSLCRSVLNAGNGNESKLSPHQNNADNDDGDNHNHHHLFHADKHRCDHNCRFLEFCRPGLALINTCKTALYTYRRGKARKYCRRSVEIALTMAN